MEIKSYNKSPAFTALYVNSRGAEKLLKKADRAVKASRDAIYLDMNIPEGHRLPLWSVLSEQIRLRQQHNKNDIVVDVFEKNKQLISIKTFDKKGFLQQSWIVNPMPAVGSMEEVMPAGTLIIGTKPSGQIKYGRSAFFDAMDSAEAAVDLLYSKDTAEFRPYIPSHREQPKVRRRNKTAGQINRQEQKSAKKYQNSVCNRRHVQRPFIVLKDLLIELLRSAKTQTKKLQPKSKAKLPRNLKKELKKNSSKTN